MKKRAIFVFALMVFFIASGLYAECKSAEGCKSVNVCTKKASRLLKEVEGARLIILDVRMPKEYKECHLEKAVNMDIYDDDFLADLKKLDKEKTYLVYCKSGKRGGLAARVMRELGFKRVFNIKGGIKQWNAEKLPVIGSFKESK